MDPAAIDLFEAFILGLGHDEETAEEGGRLFRRCVQVALAFAAERGLELTPEVAENYCLSWMILQFLPDQGPPTPAPTQTAVSDEHGREVIDPTATLALVPAFVRDAAAGGSRRSNDGGLVPRSRMLTGH